MKFAKISNFLAYRCSSQMHAGRPWYSCRHISLATKFNVLTTYKPSWHDCSLRLNHAMHVILVAWGPAKYEKFHHPSPGNTWVQTAH